MSDQQAWPPVGLIVIVCGGRTFADVAMLWHHLDRLDKKRRIGCVIEGASDDVTGPYMGADYWAHQWAKARGKTTVRVHADWVGRGDRSPGPRRNQRMLDEYAVDLVVAFPGGRGTADMMRRARAAGVKVWEPMGEAQPNSRAETGRNR